MNIVNCITLTACLLLGVVPGLSISHADDQISPLPERAFSFVVLPDTQAYVTSKTEATFAAEIQWILDNQKPQRIQFVSHVGDIINKYGAMEEWAIAKSHMMKLHGVIPFAISVGNHDMTSSGESTNFQTTFPASLFEDFEWYAGQIKNNANSYQLFEVDGYQFLWLHIECNAPDDVLNWANDVFSQYPDRRAIVTTHMYLGPENKPKTNQGYIDDPTARMKWHKTHGTNGNTPRQMWEKCFSLHKNLFLICCGDQSRTQAMHLSPQGVHGNTVHECLSDYRGGNIRLLRFVPSRDQIEVITYSPSEGKLCTASKYAPDRNDHQFTLNYDLAR
jgi:hypothetical protein